MWCVWCSASKMGVIFKTAILNLGIKNPTLCLFICKINVDVKYPSFSKHQHKNSERRKQIHTEVVSGFSIEEMQSSSDFEVQGLHGCPPRYQPLRSCNILRKVVYASIYLLIFESIYLIIRHILCIYWGLNLSL